MRLNTMDIIGDPVDGKLHLLITTEIRKDGRICTVDLDAEQTERLITYLKGLRDGLGWNRKAAEDRSL